jgi:heme A synthase
LLSPSLFRRLAFATAFFAYLQIALGGVVRVTGSGLGCPDWPLCHGRPYPPANINSIIEYSHRTVGTVTGVLVILTVVLAWVVMRRRPVVGLLASGSLVAIAAEGALGGIVVAHELAPWLVLVHLALAMLILGFLLATAVMSLPAAPGVAGFRTLAFTGAAATYTLLLTGSTVVASNADAGCHSWPLCGGGFALDFTGSNAFTMLHRGSVLVLGVLIVYVAVSALREPAVRAAGIATLCVFALQVAVGAGAALADGALFNGLHVAIATLVWAGMLSIALLTVPRTDAVPAISHLSAEKRTA